MNQEKQPQAENPVTLCLQHSGRQVREGDFATARRCLEQARPDLPAQDRERVDAARSSLRLDPAAIIVVLACLAGIATIALLTLFHGAG